MPLQTYRIIDQNGKCLGTAHLQKDCDVLLRPGDCSSYRDSVQAVVAEKTAMEQRVSAIIEAEIKAFEQSVRIPIKTISVQMIVVEGTSFTVENKVIQVKVGLDLDAL